MVEQASIDAARVGFSFEFVGQRIFFYCLRCDWESQVIGLTTGRPDEGSDVTQGIIAMAEHLQVHCHVDEHVGVGADLSCHEISRLERFLDRSGFFLTQRHVTSVTCVTCGRRVKVSSKHRTPDGSAVLSVPRIIRAMDRGCATCDGQGGPSDSSLL